MPYPASQDIDSITWQKELSTLIDHLRLRSFPQQLGQFLATQCHFDTMLMVTFKKTFKPILLYPTDPTEQSTTLHTYIDKAYVLDPLFSAIQEGTIPAVSRLKDIAPDSFESTEYYQSCYQDFDLIDEINLVTALDKSTTCAISLGRKSSLGPVTRAEMQRLYNIHSIVSSLLRQFWLSQSQEYIRFERAEGMLKQALKTFGQGLLTQREQQVATLILQGHSSKAIADRLCISLGTVKVHRKNMHARLNTSTQSELFNLFLAHMNELDAQLAT